MSSLNLARNLCTDAGLTARRLKSAFVPTGAADPAMAGGMPPGDASMMGGGMPPMDPSMMGGGMMPPMDPAMMMGGAMPPMDPSMMGAAPAPPPPADPAATAPASGSGEGKAKKPDVGLEIANLRNQMTGMMEMMGQMRKMMAAVVDTAGIQMRASDMVPDVTQPQGEPGGEGEPKQASVSDLLSPGSILRDAAALRRKMKP